MMLLFYTDQFDRLCKDALLHNPFMFIEDLVVEFIVNNYLYIKLNAKKST